MRTHPGARFRTPRLKRVIPLLPPFAELELKLVTEPSVRNRAIIAMAIYGGLRAEEIANIRRGSFIADQGLIGFVGKGGKQRSVALPPQALKIITEYLTGNGAVPRASDPLIRKQDGSGEALSYYVSPGGRSATCVCASTPTRFAMPTAVRVWTWAWTFASSLKRWDTSPWSRPRSIRRSPSSALAASPNYLAPPGRSNNPMQSAERNPLLHAGRNFQK
jgi:integrase